jgi:hypothetical protein
MLLGIIPIELGCHSCATKYTSELGCHSRATKQMFSGQTSYTLSYSPGLEDAQFKRTAGGG